MIYISCDIETSGLDPENCDILSIGAIIEDTGKKLPLEEIPKFHCGIIHHQIKGSPFALNMNMDLINNISNYISGTEETRLQLEEVSGMQFIRKDDVVERFYWWLIDNGLASMKPTSIITTYKGKTYPLITGNSEIVSISFAGKNFGTFDKKFLEMLPKWKQIIRIKQRIIDPSILYMDWKNDKELPNLSACKERAGMDNIVAHNALADAWDVIELLRKKY